MGPLTIKSEYIADSFEQSKKNKDDRLAIESCRVSQSRTGCGMVKGKITSKTKKLPVFIKFTPCRWFDETKGRDMYGSNFNASKTSPSYSEIQFFKLLGHFHEKGICDTFAKSYNSQFLTDDISMVKGFTFKDGERVYSRVSLFELDGLFHPNTLNSDIYYTMLITEPLEGFSEFKFWIDKQQAKMRKYKITTDEMKAAIFQIVYAISCMSSINMAHMDLHFGNIFLKVDERLRGKYKAYEFRNHKGEFETAYVPAHIIVKIIDFDGAHKFKAGEDVAPEFRKHIPNVEFTGDRVKRPNPRANLMKIMFHLHRHPHMSKAYREIVDANGKVPFVEKDIQKPLQQILKWNNRNAYLVGMYGVFVNKKGEMINMGEDFVKSPPEVLHLLAKTSFTGEKPVVASLSQRRIFTGKTPVKPMPVKKPTPVRKKPTPFKPRPAKIPSPSPVKTPIIRVPQLSQSMTMKLRALKAEVDAKCPNMRGRPKRDCSDALKRHKAACALDKTRVYKRRDCVPRGKPGPKPNNNGISYEKMKASAAKVMNAMNVLRHRKDILCKPRGRPGAACKEVLEQMKIVCAKKGGVFKKRECKMA
jgi:serine/threonine protein kinase